MGNYLSEPITDWVDPMHVIHGQYEIGAVAMQGYRTTMEDYHVISTLQGRGPEKVAVLGVFDGHGGNWMANYAKENFVRVLESTESWQHVNIGDALNDAFLELDAEARRCLTLSGSTSSGSTAIVVVITPDEIVCANAGDSRAVCMFDNEVVALSEDHKPYLETERKRIEASQGVVLNGRVDGNLALSRALGDFEFKTNVNLSPEQQKITAKPDIMTRSRKAGGWLLLASDGLWDVFTNEEVMEWIRQRSSDDVQLLAVELVHFCIMEKKSSDNITAIIVRF